MNAAWSLEPWLDLEWLAGSIASLKIAFWALLGLFILLALPGVGRGQQRPALGKAYRAFCWLLAMLFAGVLVYQATWQLAGFARPEFVQFIRDHEYYDYQRRGRAWPGHGTLSMRDALAESSNVYFARLGNLVGGELLQAMAERTALTRPWILHQGSSGRLTAVAGRFPTLSNRDLAKTAQISIGQGELLVTPFYLAVLAGAIGREGVVVPPRITAAPTVGEPFRMLSPETARLVAGMMRRVVTDGSGRAANLAGLDVAGKTGTAQNPHGAAHGWFMGFAPAIQPRLAFAVVVEQGGYGSQSALPIAVGLLRKTHALGGFNVPRPSPGGN